MHGLPAAAQDGGVAGLETKAGGVGGDVGTRFVNDDDDADGRGNFCKRKPLGRVRSSSTRADRVRQRGDFAQAAGHGGDAFVVELQAVEHRGGQSRLRRRRDLARVDFLQRGRALFDRVRHGQQAAVLLGGRESRQLAPGRTRLPAEQGHLFQQRHLSAV